MKWFKHYSNAHTNHFIQAIISESGLEDAMRYWLLLELLCEEFDKDSVEFLVSDVRLKTALYIKHDKKLVNFIRILTEFSVNFDRNLVEFQKISKNFWKIKTPIILELMGKDFKRQRQSGVTATPKKKEERKKKKEMIKEKNGPQSQLPVSEKPKPPALENLLVFLDQESLDWLGHVPTKTQKTWIANWKPETIADELDCAMLWDDGRTKSKRWSSRVSGFNNWLRKLPKDNAPCPLGEFFLKIEKEIALEESLAEGEK